MGRRIAAVILGAILALVAAPAAFAGTEQCGSGYACMWGENTYTGCFYQSSVDRDSLPAWSTCSTSSANNGANSVFNRGNSCNVVFFDSTNRIGVGILFNRQIDGYNYIDPYLTNGGGVGFGGTVQGQDWHDRISSLDFCR